MTSSASAGDAHDGPSPAYYDEPPQPAVKAEWPAGALLPDTGVMRKWAWRTLQAAKEELSAAVESVMEDLEGLSATSGGTSGSQSRASSRMDTGSSSGSCYTSSNEEGGTDDDEDELSMKVDDLVPPVPRRAEYETQWKEKLPRFEESFEVINWEDEISGRPPRNVVMRVD